MRTLRRLDNPALAAWLRQQQSVGPDAKPHPTRAVRRRLGAALEALAPVRELARQTGVER
jgi:hypothetical protein